MSEAQVRSLARRLASLEKWRLQSKQPNLGFSTIDGGGAIQATNEADDLTMVVGQQFDGTNAPAVVSGPIPPTPSGPVVESIIGALKVKVDGLFADGSVVPMDFARWEIHISTDPAFIPDLSTTLYATIESPRGGEHAVALPYVPHYVRVVARSIAGKGSSPSAIVGPIQPSFVQSADLHPDIDLGGPTGPDGVAPASSPDAVVSPLGIGGILASWTHTPNADPVSYEVYVSTAPITGGSADLLLTTTQANQVAITALPGGTAIVPGQQIYVRILARDEDGPATSLGAEGSAITRVATSADISSDYVYAGTVDATQIQTGSLQAVLAVLGGLTVGDLAGKQIRINPEVGFEVVDQAGQVIVSFPISTTGVNKFVGDLVAQGFTAEGRTQFRGVENEISMNSVFTMANGVTAPSNLPSIDVSYREPITTIAPKDPALPMTTWQGTGRRFSWNAVESKYAHLTTLEGANDWWGVGRHARIQQVNPTTGALDDTVLKFINQTGYNGDPVKIVASTDTKIVVGTTAERADMSKPGDTYSTTNNPWDYVTDGITASEIDVGFFGPDFKNTYMQRPTGVKTLTIQYGELSDQYGRDTRPTLSKVKIWHFNKDARKYNTKVEISADGVSWTTVFDSAVSGTYAESTAGKTITFAPQKVLYVRDTLNGSDASGLNHWTEVEAWGDPFNRLFFPTSMSDGAISRPVRIGSNWWILYDTIDYSVGGSNIRRIGKFDTTGQQLAAYDYTPHNLYTGTTMGTYLPEITTDGTDLIVGQIRPSDGAILFKHFVPPSSGVLPSPYKTVTTPVGQAASGTGLRLDGLLYGFFDMGVSRYLVLYKNPSTGSIESVRAYDSLGTRATGDDWDPSVSYGGDIAWNGTRFIINPSYSVQLIKASTSLSTNTVRAAFSWYDSDPGGTGTHETTVGPVATAVRKKRFGVSINANVSIPDAGDPDSPDSHRLYAYDGSTYAGTTSLKLLPATKLTSFGITYTNYSTADTISGTTAPPTANSFPNGFAAEFRSAIGGFSVKGDGTGVWPVLENRVLAAAANATMTGGSVGTGAFRDSVDARVSSVAPTVTMTSGSVGTAGFRDSVDARVNSVAPTVTMTSGSVGTGAFRDSVDARVVGTDTWHTVGAAGEPAFKNGWSVAGGETVKFRMDGAGNVHITGLVTGGSSATVFTLPAAYRPSTLRRQMIATTPYASSTGRIYVDPVGGAAPGDVQVLAGMGTPVNYNLSFNFSSVA